MAQITLDQARGIVKRIQGNPLGPTMGRQLAPNPQEQPPYVPPDGGTPVPGGGAPSAPAAPSPGGITGPSFDQSSGPTRNVEGAYANVKSGNYSPNDLQILVDAGLMTTSQATKYLAGAGAGGGSSGGSGGGGSAAYDPYDATREARAQGAYDRAGQQQGVDNAFAWQQLLNSQKYNDREFGLAQTQSNRGEMANRAGTGVSFGNLLLSMAQRDDSLANNPGNFPAYLQAMQGNTAMGPTLQSLVGQGVAVHPQQNSYIDDPRFKDVMGGLFDYSQVPNAGAVDQVQQAYNTDPGAAQRWFEAAAALDKGKGARFGGAFQTSGPMRMQDLTTGQTVGVAGEAGPETVAVSPSTQNLGTDTTPGLGSAGTFGALAKALRANGMYSAISPDIIQRMEQGYAPNPGDVPDWILAKLPPSLRQMLSAGITAQLGATGAQDYDYTRGLYGAKGFSGLQTGVAR